MCGGCVLVVVCVKLCACGVFKGCACGVCCACCACVSVVVVCVCVYILTLEEGTDKLSRNVSKELPLYPA